MVKVNNRYRYRVLVKCRNDKEIRAILAQILLPLLADDLR